MDMYILIICLVSHSTIGQSKKHDTKVAALSHEHRLLQMLMRNYDQHVRPRYNSSETVLVEVRFSLQQINDLDEKRQILKISGWLTAEWRDEFLTWKPEEFGGLSKVVISPTRMWVPKLAIGNSANKLFDADHYKRFWITVLSDGKARWQPGGVFAIACALNMNFYPFDDQKCTVEIETWVYTSDKVNLTNSYPFVGMDTYIPHGEWDIIKTNVTSKNVVYSYYQNESFPEVYCTIFMRRKYTFYFMYILLPCLMLSGVLSMIFLLPAQSGEKVSLGMSVLVAISVFLLLVAGNVPDTSDAIPIIAIYLSYFMMVTSLAVAMSVTVIKIHYKSPEYPPPQWLRVLFFHYIAKMVCLDSHGKLALLLTKNKHNTKSSRSKRDLTNITWSDTMTTTDDLRSDRNSRGTLSGDTYDRRSRGTLSPEGYEQYELLHSRNAHGCYETSRIERETTMNSLDSSSHVDIHIRRKSNGHHGIRGGERQRVKLHEVSDVDGTDYAVGGGLEKVNEWHQLAEVLDRFFFYLFLLFIIIPTTAILGLVRLAKPEL